MHVWSFVAGRLRDKRPHEMVSGVFGCFHWAPGRFVFPPGLIFRVYVSAELSHTLKVVDRRRNTPKSAQDRSNRCVPVCGYRAGYVGLGLAQLSAEIWLVLEELRPDPQKFSGPF